MSDKSIVKAMDIREALLAEHSRSQTMKIVRHIDGDPDRFAELMGHFLGPTYRLSQRAAWVVNYCIEHQPQLIEPYWSRLVKRLDSDDAHVAVRRNIARLLQFVHIPKRYEGRIFDACYDLFADPAEPVAVRVFSMTVAANIAKDKPELLDELRIVAKQHPEAVTAGFRSRARRVLGV
ncbi:MAG: hypothetical protein AB7J13_09655 [Pyrinomonadaceae bacterium]